MKKICLAIATVIALLLWAVVLYTPFEMAKEHKRAIAEVNHQWQKAALPVFEARRVAGLADQATPRDLAKALDVNSVMTSAERYKWDSHYAAGRTKITIAPVD
jgi:hypothetical protein